MIVEGHDHLFGRTRCEGELEGPLGLGEGHAVTDQLGEALLMLRDLRSDLEDLRGVALRRDGVISLLSIAPRSMASDFFCTATMTSFAPHFADAVHADKDRLP